MVGLKDHDTAADIAEVLAAHELGGFWQGSAARFKERPRSFFLCARVKMPDRYKGHRIGFLLRFPQLSKCRRNKFVPIVNWAARLPA
jgi:hypothetical protein